MEIKIRRPDDFHVHLRQGRLLAPVVAETARWFGRVLVMPNIDPPVTTPARLREYRSLILAAAPVASFEPLMVFKVVPELDPDDVAPLARAGAIGGKLYPQGVTTNSSDGAATIDPLLPVIEAMAAAGLVLEIHAEAPDAFCLDREAAYLPVIERLVSRFPTLRIVIEHVSSAAAVEAIARLPDRVAATVTAHHLFLTLNDVIGSDLQPHHFCKPIAKRPEDRDALLERVLSGDPRFFFGSDSAPHLKGDKESDCGCAGVYTAPVAIPLLAALFREHGLALSERDAGERACLERFVSRYGAEFYRLPLSSESITLTERRWTVPSTCHGVVPFRASAGLDWQVLESRPEEYS